MSARILEAIEQSDYDLGWSWLLMAGSCLIRAFLEGAFENTGQLGFGLEPMQSQLMVFLHLPAFFLSLFLIIILLVHGLTGQSIEGVTRAAAAGSPVIILPVVIDRLLGGGFQLYYLSELKQIPEFLLYTFAPWHRLSGASPGIRIEVALGCLAGAWYCWQKGRSVWRSAVAFVLIFLSCVSVGSLPLLFAAAWSLLSGSSMAAAQVFGPGGLLPSDTGKYTILFLFLFSGLLAAWLVRWKRWLAASLLASARPLRTVHYAGMVLLGFWAGWLAVGPAYPQAFVNPFDYLFAVGAVAAIIFVFQSAVLVNDLFDRDIDAVTGKPNPLARRELEAAVLIKAAAAYAAASLSFAAVLGQPALLIVLFSHALSLAYSAPPLRLRRYYPFSVFLIALAALAAAWLGYSAFGGSRTISLFPERLTWFILVCFGLSFATKDLNDVKGDRRSGILTLPTMLGEKPGRMATALLVGIAYVAGPLILGIGWLMAAAIPAGLATVWLVTRPQVRESLVFAVYFAYGAVVAAALGLHPGILTTEGSRARGQGLSGLEHFYKGDYDRAAPLIEMSVGNNPDRSLLWPLARSLYGAGSLYKAGMAAEQLMAEHPLYERGYHLAARIRARQGAFLDAMGIYRRALDLGLSVRHFHRQLGEVAFELDSLETALRHYRLALASGGDRVFMLARMAKASLSLGDTSNAEELADLFLKARPRRARDMVEVGLVLISIKEYEKALSLAGRASSTAGRQAEIENLRGAALEGLGRWSEAAEAYAAAVRADPNYWPSWLALSRCYIAEGRFPEAEQAMARAVELGYASGQGKPAEVLESLDSDELKP